MIWRGKSATNTSSKRSRPRSAARSLSRGATARIQYHLCYELLGQRNDITEICGRPEAQAVLARLRAIDDVIDATGPGMAMARLSVPATSGSSSRAPSPKPPTAKEVIRWLPNPAIPSARRGTRHPASGPRNQGANRARSARNANAIAERQNRALENSVSKQAKLEARQGDNARRTRQALESRPATG